MRIVIVEADGEYAKKLAHQITFEMGYTETARFDSAQSVLKAAGDLAARNVKEWDLILLSACLPDSEGSNTAQQLREILPEVPIITYTLLETAETFLRAMRTKP